VGFCINRYDVDNIIISCTLLHIFSVCEIKENRQKLELYFIIVYIFFCCFFVLQGNSGDSRSIASVAGIAQELSFDHKPSNEGKIVNKLY